jgi:hypothetical protein
MLLMTGSILLFIIFNGTGFSILGFSKKTFRIEAHTGSEAG